MSFFTNNASDRCPGRINGNPVNGLCEKVCVEVKAPRQFKELSPSYNAQMQLEMEVLDADVGLFTQGVMVGDKLKVFHTLVKRDEGFIERNIDALKKFMDDFEKAKNNHFDLELEVLSREYVALSAQSKEIQGKLSALKEKLIARGSFENAFVSVIEKTRRGGFDFAKYCSDLDIYNGFSSLADFCQRYAFDKSYASSIISSMNRSYDNAIMLRETIGSDALSYIELALKRMEDAQFSETFCIWLIEKRTESSFCERATPLITLSITKLLISKFAIIYYLH